MSPLRAGGGVAAAEPDAGQRHEQMLESVERLGWREGMADFLEGLPAEQRIPHYRQVFSDDAAWIFLLPHSGLERVLCIDSFPGTLALTLARMHPELHLAHFSRRELGAIASRLDSAGVKATRLIELDPGQQRLPFPDGCFDAVLLADPDLLPGRNSRRCLWRLPRFLAEAQRILTPEGFCCIKVRNRYAYGRLRALISGQWELRPTRTTLREIDGVAADLGFKNVTATPVLLSHDRVLEVACSRDYEPSTVVNSTRGLVKSALLGPGLAKMFAPGFVVVCSKGRPRPSFVNALTAKLTADGTLARGLRVRRYLLPSAKAILSVGRPDEPHGQAIIVLPLQSWALERRRHEAAILTGLAGLPSVISSAVPRMIAHGELYGQSYHVITEIPGRAIDSPVPGLADATREACDWIAAFHALTAQERTVTPEVFAQFFGEPVACAVRTLRGGTEPVAQRIRSMLEQSVMGRRIPTVWTHGDFKIENVLFDHYSGRIRGVIDWDLSDRQGLPLHDLLYLVAYNRQLREGRSFEAVFFDAILPWRPTEEEQALVSRYLARVRIDPQLMPALSVMAWMHHMGRRVVLDVFSRDLLDRLRSGFATIEAALKATTPQVSVDGI